MSDARRLLALDAAGAACSAALCIGESVVARRFEAMARGQSERLVPMVQETMAEAGADFASLDGIAVTVGPGGFTGVRIGLAAARGLALARELPLIGVTNFEAVAAAVPVDPGEDRRLLVLLDAKRAEVYAQVFESDGRPFADPALIAPEDLDLRLPPGPIRVVGDGVERAQPVLDAMSRRVEETGTGGLTDAVWVARVAARRPFPVPSEPPPAPLYLREPDVTLPRQNGGRSRS